MKFPLPPVVGALRPLQHADPVTLAEGKVTGALAAKVIEGGDVLGLHRGRGAWWRGWWGRTLLDGSGGSSNSSSSGVARRGGVVVVVGTGGHVAASWRHRGR